MKRFLISALFICLLIFAGCKNSPSAKVEVALITDGGTVEDAAYNEGCYLGLKNYCDSNNKKYNFYIPEYGTTESYMISIDKAITDGAKVVVCPSYMLEEAVYNSASKYPKVNFILVDGMPHDAEYTDVTIAENVVPITFSEEEAGFLAGYAAVRDGYKRLGFLGGMAEDSVIKYGYGFVQGADYAGIELGQKVYIAYTYTGKFSEDQEVQDMAAIFYDYSVEAIFACAGASGNSVMNAAEEKSGAVIGADYDHSYESPTIVFSTVKNLEKSVYDVLDDYYKDNFNGGVERHYTAAEDGVLLTMDDAKFNNFSEIEYNAILSELKSKEIVPYGNTDIGTTAELNLVNTEIIYQ
ncbi:MAG: BMP family ABC transporter substrate-binding protein [Lachnospiraceae bacterium]|nr:BMP family ABC transporter substrate-binding protein [Lachnospiraceae bacterium]